MGWEQPETRHGRTVVFLLVAAILIATALAIALVVGVASQSARSSDGVLVPRGGVTPVSPDDRDAEPVAAARPSVAAVAAPASISIPVIQLDSPLYEGVDPEVLDIGPGHWPGTVAPGGFGNLVIAGHRTTSAAPFARIGELAPGDRITVADLTGSYTYVVEGSDVVATEALDFVQQTPGHTLELIAPHPPGREEYRYVVHARLLSTPRPAGV